MKCECQNLNMKLKPTCPDEEQLWHYLESSLSRENQLNLECHFKECKSCATKLKCLREVFDMPLEFSESEMDAATQKLLNQIEQNLRERHFYLASINDSALSCSRTPTCFYQDDGLVVKFLPQTDCFLLSVSDASSGKPIEGARIWMCSTNLEKTLFFDLTGPDGCAKIAPHQLVETMRQGCWFRVKWRQTEKTDAKRLKPVYAATRIPVLPEEKKWPEDIPVYEGIRGRIKWQEKTTVVQLISQDFCISDIPLSLAVCRKSERELLREGQTDSEGFWKTATIDLETLTDGDQIELAMLSRPVCLST